ncbi:NADP-dependent malic enzyme [Klebsiella pneumoniae]|nr:NADP-dependent malic enzyme [Klebsiella pneumoniae]
MDEQLKQSALDFTNFRFPEKSVSRRPNLSPPSAIWRWPTRRASQPLPEIEKIRWPPTNTRPRQRVVVSNGTAVLGLGNIGALAGKPVMEGKGVLFKKFYRCV